MCLVLPTGGGKTVLAEEFCSREPGAVLFVVHRTDLVRQTAERFRCRFGLRDVGMVMPGARGQPHARIQVGTVQTLLARDIRPDARLCIYDECHNFMADTWSSVVSHYSQARLLGLTATPERQDGKPLGDLFDALVVGAKHSELLADGFLVPALVYQPPHTMGSDLAVDPLVAWQRYAGSEQGFVFCADVTGAETLAQRLTEADIPAKCIEAKTKRTDRKHWLAQFKSGEIRVITNVATMTEGIDVPQASVVMIARNYGHVGGYLQATGRGLRSFPGKVRMIVIDLAGVTTKPEFGMPTDDREYSLDGEGIKRSEGQPPLRVCMQCGCTYLSRPGGCPECGYVAPVTESEAPRIWDMELKAVFAGPATPDDAKAKEYARLRMEQKARGWSLRFMRDEYQKLFGEKPIIHDATEEEMVKAYEYLKKQAKQHGYRDGWVSHRFRAVFGKWPRRAA